MCSGSAHVKVHNLLEALRANRSLSVHSHIQGKIQTNKVKVAVLISGTGESLYSLLQGKTDYWKRNFNSESKSLEVLASLHSNFARLLTGFWCSVPGRIDFSLGVFSIRNRMIFTLCCKLAINCTYSFYLQISACFRFKQPVRVAL